MNPTRAPSDFESLNARFIPAETIARSFIPSQRFRIISERNHSLLVGPRGSGKTSLLKMLTTPALEAWSHNEADGYRSRIDYTGVFIPTDTSWMEQLATLGVEYLDPDQIEQLALAVLSFHVLYHLVDAFEHRVRADSITDKISFRRVPLTDKDVRAVVERIAQKANLSLSVLSLQDLRYAILDRIDSIWQFAYKERNLSPVDRGNRLNSTGFIGQHFLPLATYTVEVFNDALSEKHGRWALMFDELELAPSFLLRSLLAALRSTSPKLLFKLSLSPYNLHLDDFRKAFTALPNQDYREVRLWFSHKEEGYPFTRELIAALLRTEHISTSDLGEVFGRSMLSEPGDEPYRPGSLHEEVFIESQANDPSFAKYAAQNRINPRDLASIKGVRKASRIRKIYPNLLLRWYFRKPENSQEGPELRSRKSARLYAGAESFLAITEGNPRLVIGLVRALLASGAKDGRIPAESQSAEILSATHRYRALLRLIPAGGPSSTGTLSVLSVLDRVGHDIHREVVTGPFQPNPRGTFTVDSKVPSDIISGLGLALNAGAIILVPARGDDAMIGNLREKRFRLNYLLSPFYKIPIRLGEPIGLSKLLRNPLGGGRGKRESTGQSEIKFTSCAPSEPA